MHRRCLVAAAIGVFASVAVTGSPARATPCTNLQSLSPEHTTITSAVDNTTGVFVVPNSNPPQTIPGLPPFCRVTATITPTSDLLIKIEVSCRKPIGTGGFSARAAEVSRASLPTANSRWASRAASRPPTVTSAPAFRGAAALLRVGWQHGQPVGDRLRRSIKPFDRPLWASRTDQGFRLSRDPSDDCAWQGDRQCLLSAERPESLFRRMFNRRTERADGSTAFPERL